MPKRLERKEFPWPFWVPGCCCSVAQSCLTLCDPMNCSTPGFPVLHHLLELAQTHVCWVNDAIQPSHPLSPPSLLSLNLCQGLKIKLTKINRRKQTNLLQFSVPLEPSLGNEHGKKRWPLNTFTLALVKTERCGKRGRAEGVWFNFY